MSDETKLEGDDEITLEMHNVQRRCIGVTEVPPANWNDEEEPNARQCEYAVLAWVRANLVAPAVAEARGQLENMSRRMLANLASEGRIQDVIRFEIEPGVRSVEPVPDKAIRIMREQKKTIRELEKERNDLRAKVAELEANLAKPAPAALPKVGEPVEVRDAKDWVRKVVDVVGVHPRPWFQVAGLDGRKFFADAEDETWRRVQPQPSESAPEAAPVEPTHVPSTSETGAFFHYTHLHELSPATMEQLERWKLKRDTHGEDALDEPTTPLLRLALDEIAHKMLLANGKIENKEIGPSEPPPEDVATPELDRLKRFGPIPDTEEDAAMEVSSDGAWLDYEDVHEAYRLDLAAGIARETERLRAENEELRGEASGTLEALKLADEDLAKIFAVVEPVAKKGEKWVAAAVRLVKENDDLRRQLREHEGECAACGGPLQDRSSFPVNGVRVCGDCAQQSQSKLEAAINARRAGK